MIQLSNFVPKILVIGDLMIDHYLWGSSERISPESPVPVIKIENESKMLGGAGNVVKNLHSLGANVDILSVIGDCITSSEIKKLLSDIDVDTKFLITQKGRITSKKTRVLASQQQVARYDLESSEDISNETQNSILKTFNEIIKKYDLILLSDYGKGVLTYDVTRSLIAHANSNKIKSLVDPKGSDYSKYENAYLLTPNKKEASEATKILIKDKPSLKQALVKLKENCNLKYSLVTLSEDGVALFDKELSIHPTHAREVFDVTGAGDTVLASLGFALSCNKDIYAAIKFANLASGVVVGKVGSATATFNEIINYESGINKTLHEENIKNWDEIDIISKKLKNKNKKIVFSNGCFDILHRGHIKYLEKAKSFGDILIIGLNSDNSVRKIKGDSRPINCQEDRAYILAALEVIDYVVIFDSETPFELIELIQPDVLVKGGDYIGQQVIGQDIVKETHLIEFVHGKSTSKIINKINKL